MVALLVILTFAIMVLIDHLLLRQPILVAEDRSEAPARPRMLPSVVAGFELQDHLRYHPGHTWAVAESQDRVRVGADDFAVKLAGDITKVEIPERGQWIRQGQRIIAMRSEGRDLELVSPIEGTVVDINEKVLADPTLARKDPYGDGWLIAVNAPDASTNFRNLMTGTLARRWLDDAAARLRAYMPAFAGAVAQDGGVAVHGLLDKLPREEWDKATHEFFLC